MSMFETGRDQRAWTRLCAHGWRFPCVMTPLLSSLKAGSVREREIRDVTTWVVHGLGYSRAISIALGRIQQTTDVSEIAGGATSPIKHHMGFPSPLPRYLIAHGMHAPVVARGAMHWYKRKGPGKTGI
jgi:hypothetical protein